MDKERPETVVDAFDGLSMWRAAKPGMTLFGSHVGRVLLTTERILFLSSGTNGVARNALVSALGGPLAGLTLGQTKADELDLSALRNESSLSGRLEHIVNSRVARRWDFGSYLVVETTGTRSLPPAFSFMTRYGLSRGRLLAFQNTIESLRTRAVHDHRLTPNDEGEDRRDSRDRVP